MHEAGYKLTGVQNTNIFDWDRAYDIEKGRWARDRFYIKSIGYARGDIVKLILRVNHYTKLTVVEGWHSAL